MVNVHCMGQMQFVEVCIMASMYVILQLQDLILSEDEILVCQSSHIMCCRTHI